IDNFEEYAYLQYVVSTADSTHQFRTGVRVNYRTLSQQLLVSPRFQYRWVPGWAVRTHFNVSAGLYQQHPFYREIRDRQGQIHQDVLAQKSWHFISGMNRYTTWWGRPFTLSVQAYYKHLYQLIPYEIDNLRLRYFASNNARGYATGVDFRVNGEFIRGSQSWFSLGLLKARENIDGDGLGWIRRPTDQLVTLGIYFEDHMPQNPDVRVYVNVVIGSGYPFGPPGDAQNRNRFQGDEYYRADIGLSKSFSIGRPALSCMLRAEVLNAFGADNTLSYTWIQDVSGSSFAVPNSLSARLFNLKWIMAF
ncbi:MAG: TonB-dependent receptor, partial [Cyclobacteriaceae bacterium]|nr:TonB-dependent receptor [Cyclobacteriaceae bacterium]